jgi:exodeoxyribonuclease V alpha subunit
VPLDRSLAAVVRHLAEDPAFVGIGYATAGRLATALGDDLVRSLAVGDLEALIPILGAERSETLVAAWRDRQAEGDVVVWLAENGFEARLARKVVGLWGAEAASRLRADPWLMMALADFELVDTAARRLGLPLDADERSVAAVEAVLYRRLDENHTWTRKDEVEQRAGQLLRCRPAEAAGAVSKAVAAGAAFELGAGLQPAGAAMMETFVAEAVVELLARHGSEDLIAREVDDQDLDAWLEDASKTIGVDLGDEQRAAVRMALLGRFGLLVGGAGVGKTTVLKAVVAASEHFGRAVHQMALAGRAAVRMTQATGRKAWTIAAFLNGVEARRIVVGPEALVVVDESSMLDLPTLYRILRAIPTSGRLLLVGDPAQLPPIGFGLTLHALVATPKMPKVELRTIRRQSTASGIPMVAAAVREGRVPKLAAFDIGVAGVSLLECRQEEVADRVVDVVAELGGIANARILSALKSGSSGTIALNTRFHRIVSAGHSAGNSRFRLGEPVVFLRNDYRRDLRNGSLGEVVGVDGHGALIASFDGVEHPLNGRDLDHLDHAYAITVHKAQGSAFDTVVMPIVPSRLLDRSLIYTAMTRGIERVVLVGRVEALRKSVEKPPLSMRREVGLTDHLLGPLSRVRPEL